MRRYHGGNVWDINNLGHSHLCHFHQHQMAVVALDGGHLVFGLADTAVGLSHRSRGAKKGQMLPGSMKNYDETTQYRTMLCKGSYKLVAVRPQHPNCATHHSRVDLKKHFVKC